METKILSAQEAYKLGTQIGTRLYPIKNDENFYISTIYY